MLTVLKPLIDFEAQRQASNGRAHWIRWCAIVMAAFVLTSAQITAVVTSGASVVGSGIDMLQGLAWLNYVFIAVAALGLFATAITNERESGTLPLLVVADIPFRPFVVGKWAQFLFPAALIVLLEIPLLASATFFGGVTHLQVTLSAALLAAFLFSSSTAGVMFSVLFKTSNRAAVATAFLIGGMEFGALCARQMLSASKLGLVKFGPWLIAAIEWTAERTKGSAFESIALVINGGAVQRTDMPIAIGTVVWHILLGAVFAAIAVASAGRLKQVVEGIEIAEARETKRSSRAVSGEPVRWKEFWFHAHGWTGLSLRFFGYVLAGLATIGVCIHYKVGSRDGWATLAVVLGAIALFDLAGMAARLFGAEQKQKTLATLTLASQRSSDLFWNKLLGLLPAVLVTAGVLFFAESIRPSAAIGYPIATWAWAAFIVASVVMWLQLIVLVSFDFPSISLFVATVGLIIAWLGSFLFGAIWIATMGGSDDSNAILVTVAYCLFVFAAIAHIAGLLRISDAAAK